MKYVRFVAIAALMASLGTNASAQDSAKLAEQKKEAV